MLFDPESLAARTHGVQEGGNILAFCDFAYSDCGSDAINDRIASSELDRIDPATNSIVARIVLPKGSFNPIFAGASIWVASNEGNALVRVDPATNKVVGSTSIGPKPRFLTEGEGSVWVLNQGDGTVSRVDAASGRLLATIPAGIPGLGGEIAYGDITYGA